MTALNSRKNSRIGGGSASGFSMSNKTTNRLAATSVSANNLLDLSPMSRSSPCQMMEDDESPATGDPNGNGNIKLSNSLEQFKRAEKKIDFQSLEHKQLKGDLVPLLDTQTAVSGSTTVVSTIPLTTTNSANCISANSKPNIRTHPLVSKCQHKLLSLLCFYNLPAAICVHFACFIILSDKLFKLPG